MASLINLIGVILISNIVLISASHLKLVNNACFERVAIGKRLNNTDVSRTLLARTLRQCDMECERDMCNAYSFGCMKVMLTRYEISMDFAYLPVIVVLRFVFSSIFNDLTVLCFENNAIVVQDAPGCFRRVVTGRRLIDRYVRVAIPCDTLGHCEIACSIEKSFFCEGFNFRFDPSGQGRSSCQLTAIPVERLDLTIDFDSDLDYDFFERDRNAPPGCEHWSGMGYGVSVPTLGYTPNTYQPASKSHHDLWHNKDPSYPTKSPPTYSGGGGGGWNNYNYNQIPPSASKSHHDLWHNKDPSYPTKSPPTYSGGGGGGWNNYNYNQIPPSGGGTSKVDVGDKKVYSVYYGGSNIPSTPTPGVAQPDECFIRSRSGFRLDRRTVVISLSAPTLYECEIACANEKKFQCNLFSYRYSASATLDNCNLSERNARVINLYYDIVPDRDYDIYERNEYGTPGCQPKRVMDSDCFERVRSGLRLNGAMVQFSINTESLHECELICLHIRHFTCRAFSYRYGSPTIGTPSDNCLLSDWPITEMDPRKHFVEDPGVELYHRGSYGHGCELDRLPNGRTPLYGGGASYPAGGGYPSSGGSYPPSSSGGAVGGGYPSGGGGGGGVGSRYPPSSSGCYSGGCTVGGSYPSGGGSYPPSGGSYGGGRGPTYIPPVPSSTFLPPVPTRPTFYPPLDSHLPPSDFNKPAIRPPPPRATDKICYLGYGASARLTAKSVRSSLLVPTELECKAECTRARETTHFRCATLSYRSGKCELSDIELRDLRPEVDYTHDDNYWLFSWDFTDARCYVPPAGNPVMPPGGAGFGFHGHNQFGDPSVWTLEENQHLPRCHNQARQPGIMCYVGMKKEQWRPCSEHYYPYGQNKELHWPVAYLHREGPPGNTSFIHHQPSLVDRFLHSFRSQSSRKLGTFEGSASQFQSNLTTLPSTTTTVTSSLYVTSSPATTTPVLPNFSIVELKPNQNETKV
ncbi:LOW QUALITY PROTEIN: uncharacterized protein LOC113471719 [Diaphorina citri]|uniref:LOW QUALITY PROTEIN: uncharacterized protein LOC113471719 n=1 Tax=Diaphorina citri TaxID=121845 RepID=A0A3Q0JEG8_DIACI|nr:LOW QUALITY PROTEIN: uncharacterized protein LOC113471719 [Diaphorina citri]